MKIFFVSSKGSIRQLKLQPFDSAVEGVFLFKNLYSSKKFKDKYGRWLGVRIRDEIIEDFGDSARLCFESFGSKGRFCVFFNKICYLIMSISSNNDYYKRSGLVTFEVFYSAQIGTGFGILYSFKDGLERKSTLWN